MISIYSNFSLIFCAFSLVLFIKKIFLVFKFFRALITEGTTPPAPRIKTFLFDVSNFICLIANSKPAISVL